LLSSRPMTEPSHPAEMTINGVRITMDAAQLVSIVYPRKLTTEEHRKVRSFGFHWEKDRRAFVRRVSHTMGAWYAAEMLAKAFVERPAE
jgi:hypothetical protein